MKSPGRQRRAAFTGRPGSWRGWRAGGRRAGALLAEEGEGAFWGVGGGAGETPRSELFSLAVALLILS